MTPAFGFSVGDFIATIGLCTKVAKALRDSGEAAAEFQQVIIEIQGLQNALVRLAALEPTKSNIDHVNAIRRMALACSLPMQDFLSKLQKFEAAMSPFAPRKVMHGLGRKAQYAVFMSEEVKTLRAMISGKIISINLLLATHASETLSKTESVLSTNQRELVERFQEASEEMTKINHDVEMMRVSQEQIQLDAASSSSHLENRLDKLDDETANITRGLSGLNIGIASLSTSVVGLRSIGSQILSFLRIFPAEFRTLLQSIIRTNVQMYAVLLEIHRKIGSSPTLALESNIRVEDAFGEVRSLPYEWFRYWEPFEGLLKAKFRDTPGSTRVDRGEFRLIHAKRPTISIDKDTWSQFIRPGADVVMLMLITDVSCLDSSCPRSSCNGKVPFDGLQPALLTCPNCNLRFMPQVMAPESMHVNIIEQLQLFEDEKLFGRRDAPRLLDEGDLQSPQPDAESGFVYEQIEEPGAPADPTKRKDTRIDEVPSQPPIYSWLSKTEPPTDPDSVLRWREAEEARQAEQRDQEAKDLEVFRNVQLVLAPENEVPVRTPQTNPEAFRDEMEMGARLYYRNILDRYPSLDRSLARRLAEGNWERIKRLGSTQDVKANSMPGLGDLPFPYDIQNTIDKEAKYPSAHHFIEHPNRIADNGISSFGEHSNARERRKCSLFPPPVPLGRRRKDPPRPPKEFKCYLCHSAVFAHCKRDWSNHVMDDLRPYMCPVSDCSTGDTTYRRRKELLSHLKTVHSFGSITQCPFCDLYNANISKPNPEMELVKHLGHHLEEIAFTVVTRAYEQWSYDDSCSEPSKASILEKKTRFHPSYIAEVPQFTDPWTFPPTLDSSQRASEVPPSQPPMYMDDVQYQNNYWTRSSHPSSSASSINSQLRDYDFQRTLPRPEGLIIPPAPTSLMCQFSSKVSSSTQKKHKCKICDKRFTRPSSLRTHMYSHTGEKPYACEVEGCGKHFSVISNLRRHRKVHRKDEKRNPSQDDRERSV